MAIFSTTTVSLRNGEPSDRFHFRDAYVRWSSRNQVLRDCASILTEPVEVQRVRAVGQLGGLAAVAFQVTLFSAEGGRKAALHVVTLHHALTRGSLEHGRYESGAGAFHANAFTVHVNCQMINIKQCHKRVLGRRETNCGYDVE